MPDMSGDRELDRTILSLVKTHWQKTAMVVAQTVETLEAEGNAVTGETVATRIKHLVKADQLEAQGDLSRWRHSEVRRPKSFKKPAKA